jgi:hypothetical protein
MEVEYPILEHLIISRPLEDNTSIFQFPETLQASNLRRLYLVGFSFLMGSRYPAPVAFIYAPAGDAHS